MSRVLPILFNTDMVRAILDGRKTVTRRIVKVPPYYPHFYELHDNADGAITGTRNRLYAGFYKDDQIFYIDGEKHVDAVYYQAPCEPGDILYVRETWSELSFGYVYKADGESIDHLGNVIKWRPSIRMPKEAARIWLKVKNVCVERLQEIAEEQVDAEGFRFKPPCLSRVSADGHYCDLDGPCTSSIKYCDMSMGELFGKELWDSTIKKSDIDRYGWDANPWVWVIEFERCEKPEGW